MNIEDIEDPVTRFLFEHNGGYLVEEALDWAEMVFRHGMYINTWILPFIFQIEVVFWFLSIAYFPLSLFLFGVILRSGCYLAFIRWASKRWLNKHGYVKRMN